MVKILSFKTPYHREMGLLAKLWESLNYLDRFTKTFLVIFIGIIVTMPIITTQLFDLRQRAEQEDISQSTPNDILIKYKTGALEKNKKQLRNKYEITVSEEIKELNAERNHIKSLNKKSQIIEEIKQEKIVEYVEPNYIGKVQITKQENQINQNEDYFGPEINIANPVPLAILDTGTNYLLKTVKGYNFVNNNDNVTDSNGTGTFFTKAITSVNKEIPIIPIKVGDTTDKIYFWNLARGVVFAANQGAKIILITAGADNDSQILQEAINYAYGKNAIIVSAAGDLGYRGISSPAKLNNALAVGSLLTSGGRPEWSAVGPELDFVTKGVNINGH
ncbi:S8 family serine peptidase, partial [Patescibacteria group bacterium]|nr:S8 family serine peptidase [Patescibacteria group bacterium]